jgi:hypothetical protein
VPLPLNSILLGCHDKNCVEQDKSRHDREPIAPSDFFEKTLRAGTENEKLVCAFELKEFSSGGSALATETWCVGLLRRTVVMAEQSSATT